MSKNLNEVITKEFSDYNYFDIEDKLVNTMQIGIVTYKYSNGNLSVLSANKYMQEHFSKPDKNFSDFTKEDFSKVTYSSDGYISDELKKTLSSNPNASAERIYRLIPDNDTTPKWFFVRGSSILINSENNEYIFFVTYSDINDRQALIEDYNNNFESLLKSNPAILCAAKLNITKNKCSDKHGMTEYSKHLLEADTFDAWSKNITDIIPDQKDSDFIKKTFTREYLTEQYQNNNRRFDIVYRRLTVNSAVIWVKTFFNILMNPNTGDIEAAIYTVKYNKEYTEKQMHKVMSLEDYNSLGIYTLNKHELHLFINTLTFLEEKKYKSLDDFTAGILKLIPTENEKNIFKNELNIDNILKILNEKTTAVYTFNTDSKTFSLYVRYLDDYKDKLIFALKDVTDIGADIEESTRKLRKALKSAEEANVFKNDFLGNISHDMRTPLNAILGYTMLLKSSDTLDETSLKYVNKIEQAGDILLTLIKDTLDLHKLQTGETTLNLKPYKSKDIIDKLYSSIIHDINEKQLKFTIDAGLMSGKTVYVDNEKFLRILMNLLSNSIKFTPSGGEITLTIECIKSTDKKITDKITVRDTGIGVSEKFIKKMFEPFSQERTKETSSIGGSGLGLSITKQLVELMGGTIEARSTLGKGCVIDIYLDFDIVSEKNQEDSSAITTKEPLKNISILLCDDNDMNIEIAKTILTTKGATVDTASDGLEAFEKYNSATDGKYDIVITDIRMPLCDGYELAKKIRGSGKPDATNIPIFAISADAYESDVEKSLKAGMNRHLPKPFDPKKTIDAILSFVDKN